MTKYTFFVKVDGNWVLATRDGQVLTTTDIRELCAGSPVVKFHEKSTVPDIDIFQ